MLCIFLQEPFCWVFKLGGILALFISLFMKILSLVLPALLFSGCTGTDQTTESSLTPSEAEPTIISLDLDTLEAYFPLTETDEYLSPEVDLSTLLPLTKILSGTLEFESENEEARFNLYQGDSFFYIRKMQGPKDEFFGPFSGQLEDIVNGEFGRNAGRKVDLEQMAIALEFYYVDNNDSYPIVGGCVQDSSELPETLSAYLSVMPSGESGVSTLCKDQYFYQAYENGAARVLVAELEDNMGLVTNEEYVYCNIPDASFFTDASTLSELKSKLSAQTCDEYSQDRTMFYVLTRESK